MILFHTQIQIKSLVSFLVKGCEISIDKGTTKGKSV